LKRSLENGGEKYFNSYDDFEADYRSGTLHPGDVKSNLTDAINAMLEPVRKHFASGEPAKLLAQVKDFQLKAAKAAAQKEKEKESTIS